MKIHTINVPTLPNQYMDGNLDHTLNITDATPATILKKWNISHTIYNSLFYRIYENAQIQFYRLVIHADADLANYLQSPHP